MSRLLDRSLGAVTPHVGDSSIYGGGQKLLILDSPIRQRRISRNSVFEFGGSVLAAIAAIGLIFNVAGVDAPFGQIISTYLLFVLIFSLVCWNLHGVLLMKQRLATVMICTGGIIALTSLSAVLFDVAQNGLSVAFADFPHFFVADMTHLGGNSPVTAVGVGPAIVGTVEQVGLAAIFTVPIGILTATYLVEATGPLARIVATVVDAMTGSPAIVAGLFVYLFWVVPRHTDGKSGLAAALALSVMMLPMATRAAQEVIAVVPGSLREAALALGAPEWRVALQVVLPTARAGLANAIILAIARVTGETAPILFDVGGNVRYNWNPFSGVQDNLAFRIYDLTFQPGVNTTREEWGTSLVLIMLVFVMFVIARLLGRSSNRNRRFRFPIRRAAQGVDV